MSDIIGLLTLFISMLIQVVIPPLPAEAIVIAAATQYNLLAVTVFAGTGLYLGGLIVYIIGHRLSEVFKKFFNQAKVKRIAKKIKEQETAMLLIRILPYNPSDIIAYAAGIINVPKKKFVYVSLFTSYIRCFLLALIGRNITSWKSAFFAIGILILSAIAAKAFIRKKK